VGLEALVPSACKAGRKARENARLAAGVFFCSLIFLGLSGCASLFPQTAQLRNGLPEGLPEIVELKHVPFFPQDEYQCGPASLATALGAAGAKVTPEELVPQVYLPERKGSLQVEMLAAARRHGMVSYLLAPRFEDLLREIAAGNPVIVLQDQSPVGGWHYAVAVGYDYERGSMTFRSGETERQRLTFPVHEFLWMRSGYWAMVALPPDRIPATADEARFLSAVAALERAGDAGAARVAYASFLKRWPQNINAAIGLANAYHSLGDLKQAEQVLRDAAARAPDSAIVLNNLAQTLSDQNRDEEALPVINRAAGVAGPHAAAIAETRQAILGRLAARKKN
jgi:hypothetical protein